MEVRGRGYVGKFWVVVLVGSLVCGLVWGFFIIVFRIYYVVCWKGLDFVWVSEGFIYGCCIWCIKVNVVLFYIFKFGGYGLFGRIYIGRVLVSFFFVIFLVLIEFSVDYLGFILEKREIFF